MSWHESRVQTGFITKKQHVSDIVMQHKDGISLLQYTVNKGVIESVEVVNWQTSH